MKIFKKLFFITLFLFSIINTFSLDLWKHPENARQNSIFIEVKPAAFSFIEIGNGVPIVFPPAEITADYVLPFFLPLSIGAYLKIPSPNLKSFGLRASYHIDLNDKKLDLYFLYAFDLGFIRNDLLLEYGDQIQEIRYFDFRAGVRRFFGKYIFFSIETTYKLQSLAFGLGVKLH